MTEPGGEFFWKLALTRTPNPTWPTRQGSDHNRPTYGCKEGEPLWPRGFIGGGDWSVSCWSTQPSCSAV